VKRFIVITILLILAGGGGAGALIMLGILPNPFNPTQSMTAAESAAAKAEAAKKVYVPPGEAMTFVDLRDMVIPVVIGTTAGRKVYLSARLHVVKAQKDAVETQIVRYEDAVLDTFVPYFQTYFAKKNMMDLLEIKSMLNQMAKRLYGDKVIDVMLINVFETR
jgi:hypothetical protein